MGDTDIRGWCQGIADWSVAIGFPNGVTKYGLSIVSLCVYIIAEDIDMDQRLRYV